MSDRIWSGFLECSRTGATTSGANPTLGTCWWDQKWPATATDDGLFRQVPSTSLRTFRTFWRGLSIAPEIAVADGALGFWKALGEVWAKTREQRCWVHKTANILAKLPKSQQPKAKRMIQDIWMAGTRKEAEAAFDAFVETYALKFEKAVECLRKDREALLVFYEFPAEHWKHLRTTNPIVSTFASVRHRTVRTKGCLSNQTALAMVFKLIEATQRTWRRLDGINQLPKIVQGVKFTDGCEVVTFTGSPQTKAAA